MFTNRVLKTNRKPLSDPQPLAGLGPKKRQRQCVLESYSSSRAELAAAREYRTSGRP